MHPVYMYALICKFFITSASFPNAFLTIQKRSLILSVKLSHIDTPLPPLIRQKTKAYSYNNPFRLGSIAIKEELKNNRQSGRKAPFMIIVIRLTYRYFGKKMKNVTCLQNCQPASYYTCLGSCCCLIVCFI